MKKIITLIIVILVSSIVQIISLFPWWSFLIPVFFLGILLPLQKWNVSSFPTGFVAGLLIWILSTFYFETIYEGKLISKIREIITASHNFFNMDKVIIYSIIGLTGGILTGLAFYSGFLLRKGRDELSFSE